MRAFKQFPKIQVATSHLSKDAQKRLAWMDYYLTHNKNVSLTCRYFGISRDTFYRWQKRFNPRQLQTLEFVSTTRRPKRIREMSTPAYIQKRIYAIRLEDPEKSKYEIQAELRETGITIGYNTIQKVINRYPELRNVQHKIHMKRKRKWKIARIKAAVQLREQGLGSLVQIDTKYYSVLGVRYYLFSAIDCYSRYGFVYPYATNSSASAKDFLQRVRAYFPFPIAAINTDNGSEYLLNFHKEIEVWGIPHFFTDPHCPKQNGRVERFHQTVEYEFLNYQNLYPGLEYIQTACMSFNDKYNNHRYHQALGYKKPAEYVKTILTKQKGEVYGI